MNYQDRIVGGGLPSLMGQGDINTPGAFQFAQKSEPVVRYAVGGDVSGYQNQDDPYGLDRNLFMPQQPAQQPVAPQTPVTPFGQQQMLDLGQPNPVVRPDVQAPVAQQPAAQPVTQAPAQRRGHEEIQGSGDNAYSSWVWDEPDPNEVQQYVGKNYDVVNTPFDWAKHGFKGDAAVYGDIPLTQDEQGNVSTYRGVTGSTKEFDDWLASQGYKTAYTLSGKSGNQTRTDYLLDKDGKVIDTKQTQVDLGSTGFLDKLAAAMPAIIVGLGTGGLGLPAWAAGALAGSAAPAMKGFVEGQNLGDVLKTTGKGAVLGAIGGQASSYLNPAAAEFGKAIGGGNEFLTKLATDAASGAGRGLVGSALTGGKNLGESVLMGAAGSALGGAANTAIGQAAGAAGIPPEIMRVLGPTALAALTNKDWRLAGLTSLIGSLGQDAAQQAALEKQAYESKTDTGDELDRLLRRYPAPDEQADFTQHWYPNEGNLEEDFVVVPGGVRSTYTGETGTFDGTGKFVPNYTAPTQTTTTTPTTKSPGSSSTKPATGTAPTTTTKPTTPSSSTGGMDMNSLLALLALMGGDQQQAAPVQPLFQATGPKVSDIFKNWMA